MERYKIKTVLSTMYMGGLFVTILLEATTGQSTHSSIISESVKDGSENNANAIQAELATLREEISKLSLKQDEQMKNQQLNLRTEKSEREKQDNELQSLNDAEVSARKKQDNELQCLVQAEVSARMSQNEKLQSFLATEITARTGQDDMLQSRIDAIDEKEHNELKISIKNELKSEFQAELTKLREENFKLTSLIDAINAKPRFAAEIRPSSGYHLPHYTATSYRYIADYTELVDVGNNFDPKTGVFKINDKDQEGYYVFHINGYRDNKKGKNGSIMVYKNSNWIQGISEGDVKHWLMMNSVVTTHLKKGDEVKLQNRWGDTIYVDPTYPFTFTGYKI